MRIPFYMYGYVGIPRSLDRIAPNNFTTVTTSTFLLLIIIGSKNLLDVEKLILNSLHWSPSVPFHLL